METVNCFEADCGRSFLNFEVLGTHLEAVHSGSDDRSKWAQTLTDLQEQAKKFNTKQRKAAASKGQAMKDGSFPIQNEQDLKNAISAFGRAKNKVAAKAHIIKRAKALGLAKLLPSGWANGGADSAAMECPNCPRTFRNDQALFDHSAYVHTFEDIRNMVGEKVREVYSKPMTGSKGSTYAWVQDLTDDIVYFQVEKPQECKTYSATYSLSGTEVTLGSPTEVVRRTVYEPINEKD